MSDDSSSGKRRSGPDPDFIAKTEEIGKALKVIVRQRLNAARIQKRLSQSDVAARTGAAQQHLSLIEAGRQNITLETMVRLPVAVSSDIRELLG